MNVHEQQAAQRFLEEAKTCAAIDPQKAKTLMEAYRELCTAARVRSDFEAEVR